MKLIKYDDGRYSIRRSFFFWPNRYLDLSCKLYNNWVTQKDSDVFTSNIEVIKFSFDRQKKYKAKVVNFKKEYLIKKVTNED